jgi:hypothetical protein
MRAHERASHVESEIELLEELVKTGEKQAEGDEVRMELGLFGPASIRHLAKQGSQLRGAESHASLVAIAQVSQKQTSGRAQPKGRKTCLQLLCTVDEESRVNITEALQKPRIPANVNRTWPPDRVA